MHSLIQIELAQSLAQAKQEPISELQALRETRRLRALRRRLRRSIAPGFRLPSKGRRWIGKERPALNAAGAATRQMLLDRKGAERLERLAHLDGRTG